MCFPVTINRGITRALNLNTGSEPKDKVVKEHLNPDPLLGVDWGDFKSVYPLVAVCPTGTNVILYLSKELELLLNCNLGWR